MGCWKGRLLLLGGLAAGVLVGQAGAQQAMSDGAGVSGGIVAPEELPEPVRMTGIGNSSMKITAASGEARRSGGYADSARWRPSPPSMTPNRWDIRSSRDS